MKRSKLIALTLSGVLALSSAAILAGCGGKSKATFTWYLTAGEDGYYSDYEDNPVIEYIMENMQFEGSDGEMKYIAFDFFQPTTTENARSEFLEQNVGEIRGAMVASRIPGIRCDSKITYTFPEPYINGRQQWLKYKATGFIGGILNGQRTAEETDVIETVKAAVEQNYLYKEVYKFIKGERSLENAEWTSFARDVMNYSYTGVSVSDATAAYQAEFDRLYRS